MGVVNLELHGLLGVLIFLATVILMILICLTAFFYYKFGKDKSKKIMEENWAKYFFRSSIIFLLFDGIFFVLIITQGDKTITKGEGILFDERMIYIWIPFHIVGYFFVAILLRFIGLRKEKINKFLDKLR